MNLNQTIWYAKWRPPSIWRRMVNMRDPSPNHYFVWANKVIQTENLPTHFLNVQNSSILHIHQSTIFLDNLFPFQQTPTLCYFWSMHSRVKFHMMEIMVACIEEMEKEDYRFGRQMKIQSSGSINKFLVFHIWNSVNGTPKSSWIASSVFFFTFCWMWNFLIYN